MKLTAPQSSVAAWSGPSRGRQFVETHGNRRQFDAITSGDSNPGLLAKTSRRFVHATVLFRMNEILQIKLSPSITEMAALWTLPHHPKTHCRPPIPVPSMPLYLPVSLSSEASRLRRSPQTNGLQIVVARSDIVSNRSRGLLPQKFNALWPNPEREE